VKHIQDRYEKPELDTTELPRTHGRVELDGRGDGEVNRSGLGRKHDMRGDAHVHELPSSVDGIAESEGHTPEAHGMR
jgi:hypothetical protein